MAAFVPLVLGALRCSPQLFVARPCLRAGGDTPEELKQTVWD